MVLVEQARAGWPDQVPEKTSLAAFGDEPFSSSTSGIRVLTQSQNHPRTKKKNKIKYDYYTLYLYNTYHNRATFENDAMLHLSINQTAKRI